MTESDMLRIENCIATKQEEQKEDSLDVTASITNTTNKTLHFMQLSHRIVTQDKAFDADRGGDESFVAIYPSENYIHKYAVHNLRLGDSNEPHYTYVCNAVLCGREKVEIVNLVIEEPEQWSICRSMEFPSEVLNKHLRLVAGVRRSYGGRYCLEWKLSLFNQSTKFIPKLRIFQTLVDTDSATLATDESTWELKPFAAQSIEQSFGDFTIGQLRNSRFKFELLIFVPEVYAEAAMTVQITK